MTMPLEEFLLRQGAKIIALERLVVIMGATLAMTSRPTLEANLYAMRRQRQERGCSNMQADPLGEVIRLLEEAMAPPAAPPSIRVVDQHSP